MSSYRGPYGDLSDSDKADLETFHPDACPECGRRRCDCPVEVEDEAEPAGPRLTLDGDPNVTPRPFDGFELFPHQAEFAALVAERFASHPSDGIRIVGNPGSVDRLEHFYDQVLGRPWGDVLIVADTPRDILQSGDSYEFERLAADPPIPFFDLSGLATEKQVRDVAWPAELGPVNRHERRAAKARRRR